MSPSPLFSSSKSEERWVNHVTRNYTIDLGIHPFVYQVPQRLKDTKPEAYTPQALGLGPYHHFRPQVQQMDSQKRAAVKDYLKVTTLQRFIEFVGLLPLESVSPSSFPGPGNGQKLESTILSFYDRYVDLDSRTLAWVVLIDGIFLLHFLNEESKWQDQRLVADIMMLENQIPLVLLEKMKISLGNSFPYAADIQLFDQFYRFCDQQSPLKLSDQAQLKKAAFERHLLHFMYKLIVNNFKEEEQTGGSGEETQEESQNPSAPCLPNVNELARRAISKVRNVVAGIVKMVLSGIEQAQSQGVEIPENIDKVSKLLQQLRKTSNLYNKSDKNHDNCLADKIEVPSVSQLHYIAKIKFEITDGGIRNIWFDGSKIYLPEIRLGENTEVVLRNLLAYEAAAKPEPTLELVEYVDLMCGIIDSEIDVKLLKKFGIIKGNLLNEEIVRIFNGINQSTQRTDEESQVQNEESGIQKAVRELNIKFNNLRTAKAYKFIEKSFAALQSWIKRLFPILVLMLLSLQSFCEIYGCSSRRFGHAAVPGASSVIDGPSFGLDDEAKLMMPRKVLRYSG